MLQGESVNRAFLMVWFYLPHFFWGSCAFTHQLMSKWMSENRQPGWGTAQWAECFPPLLKVLGLVPSTAYTGRGGAACHLSMSVAEVGRWGQHVSATQKVKVSLHKTMSRRHEVKTLKKGRKEKHTGSSTDTRVSTTVYWHLALHARSSWKKEI